MERYCLVQKISSGDYFAMKIIDRIKTIEKKQEEFIKSEINIMRNLNTDYAVRLYYSFQNKKHLFFVMDYLNGGDLGNLLRNVGTLSEQVYIYIIIYIARSTLHCRNSSRIRIFTFIWDNP